MSTQNEKIAQFLNRYTGWCGDHLTRRTLHLYSNQLTVVPNSIGRMSSLKTLGLSDNQLTVLPNSIGRLSSLERLYLQGNQFTAFRISVAGFSSLMELRLDQNKLHTVSGSFIDALPSLQVLDISYNRLTVLTASLLRLADLRELMIYRNALKHSPGDDATQPFTSKDRHTEEVHDTKRQPPTLLNIALGFVWNTMVVLK